jgi:Fe-S cluster assembly protein SufB
MAFAGKGQHQDAGGKMIHIAPDTSARSHPNRSANPAAPSYCGLVKILHGASGSNQVVASAAVGLDA